MNSLKIFNITMSERKYVPKEINRHDDAATLFLQLRTLKLFEDSSEEFLTELYTALILLRPHWKPAIDAKESKLIKRIALWFKMGFSRQLLSQDTASKKIGMIEALVKSYS